MSTRILFVCLGNICRSPAAEGVVRAMAEALDLEIDSAATSAFHTGDPPYAPMIDAASLRGYDLSRIRARHFNRGDFGRFDLIIGMDADNLSAIEALRPEGDTTPVRNFTDFAPGAGRDHVPDPYYTRDFDGALDLIEACSRGLVKAIADGRV